MLKMHHLNKATTVFGAVLLLSAIVSGQEQLSSKNNETQKHEGRSMDTLEIQEKPQQRGRSGRMMDLDHLAGAIGKDEKVAKERSINGNRQSRILSEDIVSISPLPSSTKNEGRSPAKKKKGSGKKMAIKGFIPIVSMEHMQKGGNPLEDESDEDEESSGEEQSLSSPQQNQDQLLSGYGSQTSMGHASFVGETSQQQQPQWQQLQNPAAAESDSAARARKLLHGNSGILSAPKRLISTLVPGQQQLQQQAFLGMASQQFPQMMDQYQQGETCICVPFFQCRNGYLSANQLSKSQLQQISAPATQPLMSNQYLANQQHYQQQQVPRAQKSATDLYYNNQQPLQQQQQHDSQSAGLSPSQPDDQQAMNDAYEQLKKTMESENLEQLLLQQQQQQQQMLNLPLLDERSKAANQQVEPLSSASSNSTPADSGETQERSLLPNPLSLAGRRQSLSGGSSFTTMAAAHSPKSCGIMRTCCKIPPNMMGGHLQQQPTLLNRGPQAPRLLQQQQLVTQQFYPRPHLGQRLPTSLPIQEHNFQGHHQQANDYPTAATSALIPSIHSQFQQQQQQQQLVSKPPQSMQQQQQQQHPMGSFMAGRCGTRQALGVAGRVQNVQPAPGSETTAEFGEFPSHAAILKRLSPGDSLFVCSAVLISNQWLATAAHCIKRHRPEELKVRLGEWDVQRDDEFYPFVELNVRDIIVHPEFQPSSLVNDLALLRLESALDAQQMPHIAPACLATPDELFARSRCWLTGWGKDAFGQSGSFQSILKKVDLPVMDRQQCESSLRYQTKLGKFFRLHQSALCAGGERGKDACEGDGGSGLYCTDPESGLTKVIGLVSWGVGCGQVGVPGVYTNLGLFYPWIESVIASSGEENLYMDRNSVAASTAIANGNGNAIPDNVFKSIVSERSNQGAAAASNNSTSPVEISVNSTMLAGAENEELESRAG